MVHWWPKKTCLRQTRSARASEHLEVRTLGSGDRWRMGTILSTSVRVSNRSDGFKAPRGRLSGVGQRRPVIPFDQPQVTTRALPRKLRPLDTPRPGISSVPSEPGPVIDAQKASVVLGCSQEHVERLAERGQLPGNK